MCSNNMQEGRLFELEYDQACRKSVYLIYVRGVCLRDNMLKQHAGGAFI